VTEVTGQKEIRMLGANDIRGRGAFANLSASGVRNGQRSQFQGGVHFQFDREQRGYAPDVFRHRARSIRFKAVVHLSVFAQLSIGPAQDAGRAILSGPGGPGPQGTFCSCGWWIAVGMSLTARRALYIFQWLS
jgi:hypothetical protein